MVNMKLRVLRALSILVACVSFSFVTSICEAQSLAVQPLKLRNRTINITANAADWLKNSEGKYYGSEPLQVIIKFRSLPDEKLRRYLKENGVCLSDYIDNNTYTAIVYPYSVTKSIDAAAIYSIINIDPKWKADDIIWKKVKTVKSAIDVLVSFADTLNQAQVQTFLSGIGAVTTRSGLNDLGIYKVSVFPDQVNVLSSWYGVKYISPAGNDVPLDAEANATQRSIQAMQPVVYGGYELTGDSVTVGVGDNTSGIFHIDLKDRIINYNPYPYEYHGVHTSGTVGGAGIIDPKGQGMASHTKIINQLFSGIWEQTGDMYNTHNMTITNNSYAAVIGNCDYAGTYDVNSEALDKMCLKYNSVLHVFAAGNDGLLTCGVFPQAFATISGGYQPAKNILVVSSVDKHYLNEKVTGSRGPVKDGRLRPEMVAVGADVNAPTKTEEYLVTLGTSMASPQVAGAVALLTERYRKAFFGNVNPRADLLKALILNGTTDVGNPGPDYTNGFGVLNLDRSIEILNNSQYYTNTITQAAGQTVQIPVSSNIAQLKVMLYWNDVAASPLSAAQLVNDLDLEVSTPASVVHHPLILDPTPANVNNNAVEGVDHLNNCEQVIINNPTTGYYTISVKGTNIPSASQGYVVVYDFIPVGVQLTNPLAGSKVKANDSLFIYWNASDDNNTFKLEYSVDNGGNWTILDNNIPASQRYYVWYVPSNINSGKCLVRLSRNNTAQSSVSGLFVINDQQTVSLANTQCPGYISIEWPSVPNASAYEVWKKTGPYMIPVDTVNSLSYVFKGLSLDSFYYVAVSPVIDGLSGYRSIAVKRRPDDGDCTGSISDGDMMVQGILAPNSGRKFTSSELGTNEPIKVLVRNLDDVAVPSYKLSYSVNGSAWDSVITNNIPANANATVTLPGFDFSAHSYYNIRVAVSNLSLADGVPVNDSASRTILSMANGPVDLNTGFSDGFEDIGVFESVSDTMGMSPNEHWDYTNSTDTGRIRTFINPSITINGNRSLSMDAYQYMTGNRNDLIGTFNFKDYDANKDEVRLEFSYILHGRPSSGKSNFVSFRGKDNAAEWGFLYQYDTNRIAIGEVTNSKSISLTDAMLRSGQNFSSSTQLMFSHEDNSVISSQNFGKGLTIDDVKLYTVKNDMQLVRVVSPANVECGLNGAIPLTIRLYNTVFNGLDSVKVHYRLNGGAVVNETIAHIGGKDSVDYTFTHKIDASAKGMYMLDVWLDVGGDTYRPNDSILNYRFYNEPLIAAYPYLEQFESGDGYWHTEGQNNSWEYGMPASPKINKAYSGTRAWKTNLDGVYNNLEFSYLYSPCFDLSVMVRPRLSFMAAMDIENCGEQLCDVAYIEYSNDGQQWYKLGTASESSDWYNDSLHNVWSIEDKINWRRFTTLLPAQSKSLKLRFVFNSDPGLAKEGIAVDDISVYDDPTEPIKPAVISVSPNPTHDGLINIYWKAASGTEMGLMIADIAGREVYKYNTTAANAYNRTTIQTPVFASGVYIIKFKIGKDHFEAKIVYN